MASVPERRHWTEAEYLAFERQATTKHEYRGGEVVAMVGGTPRHNQIVFALGGMLYGRLLGGPCTGYSSDQRVRVGAAGLYAYPDVVIVCGGARFDAEVGDTLLNPTVIFEVLSPSTEHYDRNDKFEAYKRLASLREYLLVAQSEARIEQWVRQETGVWAHREVAGLGATLALASVDATVPLAEIYARVTLG